MLQKHTANTQRLMIHLLANDRNGQRSEWRLSISLSRKITAALYKTNDLIKRESKYFFSLKTKANVFRN